MESMHLHVAIMTFLHIFARCIYMSISVSVWNPTLNYLFIYMSLQICISLFPILFSVFSIHFSSYQNIYIYIYIYISKNINLDSCWQGTKDIILLHLIWTLSVKFIATFHYNKNKDYVHYVFFSLRKYVFLQNEWKLSSLVKIRYIHDKKNYHTFAFLFFPKKVLTYP